MIRHSEARLQLARVHSRWTRQQWKNVLFTDEMRACLPHIDGRRHAWRWRGERHSECCVEPVTAFGGGSVMVWGGITLTTKTHLIQINGNLNSNRYVAEILCLHVVPHATGNGFILMDDNVRPHRGRVVTEFLAGAAIELMVWPANSRDLNPIEHLWHQLKHSVYGRIAEYSTLEDLTQLLQEELTGIPQQRVSRLVNKMRRRCLEVIEKRGGYTHY